MNKKLFTLITIFILTLSTLFSFDVNAADTPAETAAKAKAAAEAKTKTTVKPQDKGIVGKAVDGVIDTVAPKGSLLATLIPSKKNCNYVTVNGKGGLYQPFSDIDESFPGASTLGLVKSEKDPSVTCIKVEGGVEALLKMLFTLAISLIIILAVINISVSGIQYMTQEAVGKKGEAKKRLQNSLIALALGLMSYAILYTVNKQLVSFEFNPSGLDVDGSIDRGIARANRDVGTFSTDINGIEAIVTGVTSPYKTGPISPTGYINTQTGAPCTPVSGVPESLNPCIKQNVTPAVVASGNFGSWNETSADSWVLGLMSGPRSTDGRLVISVYSKTGDSVTDRGTASGRGNSDNLLREGSVALSPDVISKYRPKVGQEVFVNGTSVGFFEDTSDDSYGGTPIVNTVDIYDENKSMGHSILKNIPAGQWTLTFGDTKRPQISNPSPR